MDKIAVLIPCYNEAKTIEPQETNLPDYYTENKTCIDIEENNTSNKIAKNVFNYTDKSDYTYGGYQDYPEQP